MRDLALRALRVLATIIGLGLGLDAALLLSWLVWQLPGGDSLVAAVWSLIIGASLWYWTTSHNEARGGHLWWPGRIEDRWRS